MRNMKYLIFVFAIVHASGPSGVYGQAAISTGDLASAAPADATAAAPASIAGASVQDSSAAVDLSSDSSTATPAPAPAPAPALAPVPVPTPAKARVKAPAPAPARAPAKAPAKAPARAPSRAPAPKPAARTSLQSSAPSQAPAPGPSGGGGGNATAADITNVVQARAATFTRANTLFLAGVTPRVDWTADLGETGRRTGRFRMDYFVSAAFNQSTPSGSAWLGNPQAVIQGVVDGGSNETSMVAILSQPRYNASADTLSFVVSPVTDPAALKLSAGTANAALAGDPANRLNSTTVGLILKDVVIYIDDATGESAVEAPQGPGQKSSLVTFGPWGNGFGGGWNPCWGAGRRRWGDDWVRRNYFGCGGGVWFGR